jgi:hypothetical protein
MGSGLTVPVSALDWESLEAEAWRISEAFVALLSCTDDDVLERYHAIRARWHYIQRCVAAHPSPGRKEWYEDMTHRMSDMTSRFRTIRSLGLSAVDELDETLLE